MKQVNVKTMRAVPQNGGDMYDCIVIGAGIAGAVAARKLAEEKGKRLGRGPIIVSVEEDSLVVRPIKKSFLNYLNFI